MELNQYQKTALETAVYPKEYKTIYPALGMNGEAGEVADKVKKVLRDSEVIVRDGRGAIVLPDAKREELAKGKIPEFEAQEEVAPVQTPPKEEEIVEERLSDATPLLDFELDTDKKMSAEEWLQQLLDKELVSEQDLAAFLYKRGWKLQEPVRSYKKFTL